MNGCFWTDCTGPDDESSHSECVDGECVCVAGQGQDACDSSADCQEENKPIAHTLSSLAGNYCTGLNGMGIAYFKWYYLDPGAKKQTQYTIQIDNNSDFSSPEVNRTVYYTNVASGSLQQQLILVKQLETSPGCDFITYNTTYYWRVKVKNTAGVESSWIYHNGSYGTATSPGTSYTYEYAHPAPVVAYSIPETTSPGSETAFSDSSLCYTNGGTSPQACSAIAQSYLWDFGDAGYNSAYASTDTTMGSVTHIYTTANDYITSLKICDDIACCTAQKPITVVAGSGTALPKWREVSPF